jgi:hypothetical protein
LTTAAKLNPYSIDGGIFAGASNEKMGEPDYAIGKILVQVNWTGITYC